MPQYTPKTWTTGETITAAELNAIEQAAAAAAVATDVNTSLATKVNSSTYTAGLAAKVDTASLAAVAQTGSYTDLANKPTIPAVNLRTLSANATLAAGDVVEANATSGPFTLTLPASPAVGAQVQVKKLDASANAVTVSGGTIDGDPSLTLTAPLSAATLIFGTQWRVIGAVGSYSGGTPYSPAPTAPGAPTGVAGTAGNTQASLSWTAPASNGGAAITDYIVQYSSNGGTTWTTFADGTSTATTATVTGLTNGTGYVFHVAAVNSVGTGAYSSASGTVTPTSGATVPGQVTGLTPTAGSTQVALAWTAPGSNGGSAITDYLVEFGLAGSGTWGTFADGTSTATTATVTGLTNGTAYDFRVSAVNAIGTGLASATATATPAAAPTVPGAPTIGTATGGNASATVAFTAPASNGGSAITGYTATSTPGSLTGTGTSSPITVSGLTNGTAYTFTVHATNSVGNSAESAASNSVTPASGGISDPTGITGLLAWYDATQIAGATNSNKIASWPDMSGNANNLAQATSANQPAYWTASPPAGTLPNGKPSVYFGAAGATTYMDSAALGDPAQVTVFSVWQINSGTGVLLDKATGGTGRILIDRNSATTMEFFAGTGLHPTTGTNPLTVSTWTFVSAGASSVVRRDGTQVSSGSAGTNSLGSLRMGASQGTATSPWAGLVSEIVVYNRALTLTEQQQVEAYLKTKWGTP